MRHKIPSEVARLLDHIANKTKKLLDNRFVGLYVHGSLAMGCFNPRVSDIDFLIVVRSKLSVKEKRELLKTLLNSNRITPKGLEMSVVLLEHVKNPVFPTPFEFHFSKDSFGSSGKNRDPDLAAHFTITKKRGIAWRGLTVDEVFSEIPKEMVVKSLLHDFGDLGKNMLTNPVYGILNACRTIAYLKDGLVLSKKEGGVWALKNFDKRFFPIVRQALSAYKTNGKFLETDPAASNSFIDYVNKLVKKL